MRVQTRQGLRISLLQITSLTLLCEIRCVFPGQTHRNRGRKRGTRSLRRLYNLRGAHDISLVAGFAFQAYKHPHLLPSMDTPSVANILVSSDGEEIEIAGSMRGFDPLYFRR